ncbi:hypothetical protein BDN70DRAFT_935458 [Pholiota conissans]|uniref:F-box domain-containing protein n=1 Tax=Pholiota conissans TaxID=109636 RepID=A0A9P5YY21_9AGAR|nr:hypothetical protein BDN70DRAFT_935458 [Pholiota conissans]
MSVNALPSELISLIVEYLEKDRESLKSAALVSPSFLPVCRSYLFKQLCISSFNPVFDYQCSAWSDIVQRSAEVLQYIRILEIGPPLPQARSLWSTYAAHQNMPVGIRPSINDPRLKSIVSGIKRPRSATFRFQLSQWQSILPGMRTAIRSLISQEMLTSLSIEDVNDFPLNILRDCKNLLHLTLISVHPSPSASRRSTSDVRHRGQGTIAGYLQTLTLMTSDKCIEDFVYVLASSLGLRRLRKLAINMGHMNSANVLHDLSRASPNLRSVTLRLLHQWAYDFYNSDDFPKVENLFISVSYNRHLRPIQALASFLSKFKSQNALEELTVLFRLDVPQLEHENNSQWLERICNNHDWKLVEEQCVVSGRFSALRKITIAFRPKDVKNFMSTYLAATMPVFLVSLMPKLSALTSPTIEFCEDQFEGHQYAW